MTHSNELIRIPEMADELGMTEVALRSAINKGKAGETIPPLTRLGSRVVFLRSAVEIFYANLASKSLEDSGLVVDTLTGEKMEKKSGGRPAKGRPTDVERRAELAREGIA